MRGLIYGMVFAVTMMLGAGLASAVSWDVSCSVDKGAIRHKGDVYVFKTSTNHCKGGIFHQRAEISTGDISIKKKVTYVVDVNVAMQSADKEDFVVFQVHDGRIGCSPPLSVRWRGNGRLSFDSDYTRGIGMAGCVENRGLRDAAYRGPSLKRDGTAYQLQFQLAFDGKGRFDATVLVDGKLAISGTYSPSSNAEFVASSRFFMKHGVYSKNMFDYELVSTGLRVSTAR